MRSAWLSGPIVARADTSSRSHGRRGFCNLRYFTVTVTHSLTSSEPSLPTSTHTTSKLMPDTKGVSSGSCPFLRSSARAYLGIGVAVLGAKRRLLLHSAVAVGVVNNAVLVRRPPLKGWRPSMANHSLQMPTFHAWRTRPERSECLSGLQRSPLRDLIPRS
jgi:hypothetical protein